MKYRNRKAEAVLFDARNAILRYWYQSVCAYIMLLYPPTIDYCMQGCKCSIPNAAQCNSLSICECENEANERMKPNSEQVSKMEK